MTKKLNLKLPYNGWMARPHQLKLWEYLIRGGKRAIAVWHRRAGKDEHSVAPYRARGRHASWQLLALPTGVCPSAYAWCGLPSIRTPASDALMKRFRVEWRANTNDCQMLLRFKNGSPPAS